MKLICFEVGV